LSVALLAVATFAPASAYQRLPCPYDSDVLAMGTGSSSSSSDDGENVIGGIGGGGGTGGGNSGGGGGSSDLATLACGSEWSRWQRATFNALAPAAWSVGIALIAVS
jgi:hypothetical protein